MSTQNHRSVRDDETWTADQADALSWATGSLCAGGTTLVYAAAGWIAACVLTAVLAVVALYFGRRSS